MAHISGMIRAMSAVPRVHLADPQANVCEIVELLRQADAQNVRLCVFPELCLCGYTCADLLIHPPLLSGCLQALDTLLQAPVRLSSVCRLKSADGCITAPSPSAVGAFSALCRKRICRAAANSTRSAGSSRDIPRRKA